MERLFIGIFFFANILYCLAYVVRDILWLRILTIIAAFCTFPYFYFQEKPLYSALFWQTSFILINAINLTDLILKRRPVHLTEEQQRLHLLVFRSLTPREMLKLIAIAEWKEAKPGEILINKGVVTEKLLLVFHGIAKVEANGEVRAHIRDGGFLGEMSYTSGKPTSADVVAMEHTRYLCWSKDNLELFFEKEQAIKDVMQTILGCDMAEKLRNR